MPERTDEDLLRATLAAVAPGTDLRDGLERILRGRTGALIVLGNDKLVDQIATGGFPIDIEFSATRLRELAKMDGAIVVTKDLSRIVKAATQLLPDASIETSESGTRHRTAERVAKQTGYPVISVSQSMQIIALYVGGQRRVIENSSAILSHANQALATLGRYKARLDEVTGTLSALEIEDYVVELGTDGRLLSLQLEELTQGVGNDRELVIRDYLHEAAVAADHPVQNGLAELAGLTTPELIDLQIVSRALGFSASADVLDQAVSPIGFRLLSKIPRLPATIVDRLVDHFGSLQRLLAASLEDLMDVDGVGESRARAVREGLSRLAESSILERYV